VGMSCPAMSVAAASSAARCQRERPPPAGQGRRGRAPGQAVGTHLELVCDLQELLLALVLEAGGVIQILGGARQALLRSSQLVASFLVAHAHASQLLADTQHLHAGLWKAGRAGGGA